MIRILTAAQMQACDRAAIEVYGIPETVLMENAGTQVVETMEEFFVDPPPLAVAVCCGRGNNGGDGLVVARHLHNLGRHVHVYLFARADQLNGSAALNHAMAVARGVPITEVADAGAWASCSTALEGVDCIVDALLGTGLEGGLRGYYVDVVDAINAAGAPVVAVDIPSGLSADTGGIEGAAVDADLTVALATPKLCHLLPPAEELCGELTVADIGIPETVIEKVEEGLLMLSSEDGAALLPWRRPDTHKGNYGRVLVVGGAVGTTGAAALTALGALRGGAGLVTVATPASVYPIVAGQLTEALVYPLAVAKSGGGLGLDGVDEVLELAHNADVLAIGPGVGTDPETFEAVRRTVREVEIPTVIDADGLNALVDSLQALEADGPPRVLTPHPGEMGRLMGCSTAEVQEDRRRAVTWLAGQTRATVVLKGYRSLVAGPRGGVAMNPTGNPGMATGGAGDVLTGLIAALLGQSLDSIDAARLGVYLHGLAGDLAAEALGETALIAGDLVAHLPHAFESLQAALED
ncbi:MAG: NAD(P)H-hydrate dehydratase [Acidobacteriota bacterium]